GAGHRADNRRGDGAEDSGDPCAVTEVDDATGRAVLGGARDMEQLDDPVGDGHRAHGQKRADGDETSPAAQFQQVAHDEAAAGSDGVCAHAAFSNRVVISRKRSSSEAWAGSRRSTSWPALTSRRLSSGTTARSASTA